MKRMMLAMIRYYQKANSPHNPGGCRLRPSCSAYAVEAINKHGALKGGWLALRRLSKCHPFYKGDPYDPVP